MIESLISDLSHDPFNPEKNFECAVEYHRLNQTASAISFYLRTAEYGYFRHKEIAYASLLKLAECFEHQTGREHTVSNCLLQAIAYDPSRKEGYLLLSQYYEKAGAWQESYTFATMGYQLADKEPLPVHVGYFGEYCLEYQIAVAAYWIGRKDESLALFNKLLTLSIEPHYEASVKSNLERLNA